MDDDDDWEFIIYWINSNSPTVFDASNKKKTVEVGRGFFFSSSGTTDAVGLLCLV